jgi:hypothetical protein
MSWRPSFPNNCPQNGELTITIPKKAETQAKKIQAQSKAGNGQSKNQGNPSHAQTALP